MAHFVFLLTTKKFVSRLVLPSDPERSDGSHMDDRATGTHMFSLWCTVHNSAGCLHLDPVRADVVPHNKVNFLWCTQGKPKEIL